MEKKPLMIDLNLLPDDLKLKEPKVDMEVYFSFLKGKTFSIFCAIFLLLLLTHTFLGVTLFFQRRGLSNVKKCLDSSGPQVAKVQQIEDIINTDKGIINDFDSTLSEYPAVAESLYYISRDLPATVWLDRLSWDSKAYNLLGKVVLIEGSGLDTIAEFANKLTAASGGKLFSKVQILSTNTTQFSGVEVLTFQITCEVK